MEKNKYPILLENKYLHQERAILKKNKLGSIKKRELSFRKEERPAESEKMPLLPKKSRPVSSNSDARKGETDKDLRVIEENAILNKYLIEFNEKVDGFLRSKNVNGEAFLEADRTKTLKLSIIEKELHKNQRKLQDLRTEREEVEQRIEVLRDKKYGPAILEETKRVREALNETRRTISLLVSDQKRNFKEMDALKPTSFNVAEEVPRLVSKLKATQALNSQLIARIDAIKHEFYGLTDQYSRLQSQYRKSMAKAMKAGVYDNEHRYYLLNLQSVKLEKAIPLIQKKQEFLTVSTLNEISSLRSRIKESEGKIAEFEKSIGFQERFLEDFYRSQLGEKTKRPSERSFEVAKEMREIFGKSEDPEERSLALSPMVLSQVPLKFLSNRQTEAKKTEDFYLTACEFAENSSSKPNNPRPKTCSPRSSKRTEPQKTRNSVESQQLIVGKKGGTSPGVKVEGKSEEIKERTVKSSSEVLLESSALDQRSKEIQGENERSVVGDYDLLEVKSLLDGLYTTVIDKALKLNIDLMADKALYSAKNNKNQEFEEKGEEKPNNEGSYGKPEGSTIKRQDESLVEKSVKVNQKSNESLRNSIASLKDRSISETKPKNNSLLSDWKEGEENERKLEGNERKTERNERKMEGNEKKAEGTERKTEGNEKKIEDAIDQIEKMPKLEVLNDISELKLERNPEKTVEEKQLGNSGKTYEIIEKKESENQQNNQSINDEKAPEIKSRRFNMKRLGDKKVEEDLFIPNFGQRPEKKEKIEEKPMNFNLFSKKTSRIVGDNDSEVKYPKALENKERRSDVKAGKKSNIFEDPAVIFEHNLLEIKEITPKKESITPIKGNPKVVTEGLEDALPFDHDDFLLFKPTASISHPENASSDPKPIISAPLSKSPGLSKMKMSLVSQGKIEHIKQTNVNLFSDFDF